MLSSYTAIKRASCIVACHTSVEQLSDRNAVVTLILEDGFNYVVSDRILISLGATRLAVSDC